MTIARHDDPAQADQRNGHEPGELTAAQMGAARLLNYQRAMIRREPDEERRQAPPRQITTKNRWQRIDWGDVALRELLAAVITGVILSGTFYVIESRREERMLERSERLENERVIRAEQLEDERAIQAERLENVGFVRQLSISSPDSPKPLTGIDLSGVNLSSLNLTDANLRDANLADTNLFRANLTRADLTAADLIPRVPAVQLSLNPTLRQIGVAIGNTDRLTSGLSGSGQASLDGFRSTEPSRLGCGRLHFHCLAS